MSAPRILHVTQATTGGVCEYLRLLAARQRPQLDVEVACPDDGPLAATMTALGLRVHRVPMTRAIDPRADFESARSLAALFAARRPALVHLHSSKAGAVGRAAAWLTGVPTVYTPHGWSFDMALPLARRLVYVAAERAAAALGGRIVAISRWEAASAARWRVAPAARVRTIANGIDVARFAALDRRAERRRLGLDGDRFLVGMAARLEPQKDPLTFVRAAARVAARHDDVDFVLVGDGSLRRDVEAAVASLGLGARLRLCGWQADVAPWLAACDAGLLTSRWEGFGLAAAEYMAAGAAAVVARTGGLTEVVDHERTGLLAAPGDAAAFAAAICRLRSDETLRHRLTAAARREVAARFDIERVAAEHLALYHDIWTGEDQWRPSRSFPIPKLAI